MKYGERQTFRCKTGSRGYWYVVIGMVHTHIKFYRISINAKDATIVRGDKGAEGVPAQRKCPFIVEPNCTVTYVTCHDATYGEVHAAVVKVKDSLTIIPDMIASNEMAPANIASKKLESQTSNRDYNYYFFQSQTLAMKRIAVSIRSCSLHHFRRTCTMKLSRGNVHFT